MNQSIFEIIAMLEGQGLSKPEIVDRLSVLAEPPDEGFQPNMRLPDFKGLASYNVAPPGVGAAIADKEHAEPAPLFGEKEITPRRESVGELLIGDLKNDGA